MRRGQTSLNHFKFGTFFGRFPSDGKHGSESVKRQAVDREGNIGATNNSSYEKLNSGWLFIKQCHFTMEYRDTNN